MKSVPAPPEVIAARKQVTAAQAHLQTAQKDKNPAVIEQAEQALALAKAELERLSKILRPGPEEERPRDEKQPPQHRPEENRQEERQVIVLPETRVKGQGPIGTSLKEVMIAAAKQASRAHRHRQEPGQETGFTIAA